MTSRLAVEGALLGPGRDGDIAESKLDARAGAVEAATLGLL